MSSGYDPETVGGVLSRLFPKGTNPDLAGQDGSITRAPHMPADVFGAVAHMLYVSGAYQFLVANISPDRESGACETCEDPSGCKECDRCEYQSPVWHASSDDMDRWVRRGRLWRDCPASADETDEDSVAELWRRLLSYDSESLVKRLRPDEPTPEWWKCAHALLVISDEASADIGFASASPERSAVEDWASTGPRKLAPDWASFVTSVYEDLLTNFRAVGRVGRNPDKDHVSKHGPTDTIAFVLNSEIVRVLPKNRTPALGCSMRTMSHNLAILSPRGPTNVYWHSAIAHGKKDSKPLNILMLPYPYQISPNCFSGTVNGKTHVTGASGSLNQERWGRFSIFPRWLSPNGSSIEYRGPETRWSTDASAENFVSFALALVEEAERDCGAVHGIVLPEYALDWPTYYDFVAALKSRKPQLEFLISGLSENCESDHGNTVMSTIFATPLDRDGKPLRRKAVSQSRRKHHRWRLDGEQIKNYGLASALDPFVTWWEYLAIGTREMQFNVFRQGSTFTTMICEDLARFDPAHPWLRALGPNLVFVILMDGPQLPTRWPGRYATVIADDPGSSVLTLTSRGLIVRSNMNRENKNYSIGLWRDDTGHTVELHCPPQDQAILLTLSGKNADEVTLDGRPNYDARAWRYHGHRPVRLSSEQIARGDWGWILGERRLAASLSSPSSQSNWTKWLGATRLALKSLT
ncbi:hypothetical protein GJ654_04970 [Rhodoblastus acidophilus]|uniref:Uncharacterized protein n=1 Tax=Rhodoblastus acidophilus TaxID=1074 RepID=A0A6N8DIL1_RHOAC|nr:hypothetical protein [Rhodoblastus acidophilus]MCW2273574.1 hypothetical protein [Rhodoblastus acidophilus]MTV30342.1 hypothetical protein [Rhodoblastus acidophilus]